MDREKALAAQRSEYDDLTAKLRASDERRMQLERGRWTRCASASPNSSSRNRPRAWAWSNTPRC